MKSKDTKRLDFVDKGIIGIYRIGDREWAVNGADGPFKTVRTAIDCAMKLKRAEKKGGKK